MKYRAPHPEIRTERPNTGKGLSAFSADSPFGRSGSVYLRTITMSPQVLARGAP